MRPAMFLVAVQCIAGWIRALVLSIVLLSGGALVSPALAGDGAQSDGYVVYSKAGSSSEWRCDPIAMSGPIAASSSNSSTVAEEKSLMP